MSQSTPPPRRRIPRKKPLIGVTMHYDHFEEVKKGVRYRFIREEYGAAITRVGGEAIFLDGSISPQHAAAICDGIVISGGEDINPTFYGEKQLGDAWLEPTERTTWERALIDACDKLKKPILGICYGHQLLNVHYGGTLYQDIISQCQAMHHGTSSKAALQDVLFDQTMLGFRKGTRQTVAHRHHQAVAKIAPGMKVVGRAADGTIEAIAGRGHHGIQWHPEADGSADQVYGPFIDLAAKRKLRLTIRDIMPRVAYNVRPPKRRRTNTTRKSFWS